MNQDNSSKKAIITSTIIGKISSIIGYTLVILFLLCALGGGLQNLGDAILFILLFLVPGVVLIINGIQIKNRIKRFKGYENIILLGNETSLEGIAAGVSRPIDFVVKDIQKMIEKRYFVNAYIDRTTNEIVLQNRISRPDISQGINNISGQVLTVTCKNCGASNSIRKGAGTECEFCGSPL